MSHDYRDAQARVEARRHLLLLREPVRRHLLLLREPVEARFFECVEKGMEVTPTDKSYKAYVRGAGGSPTGKFYFQHLSEDGRSRFLGLVNSKKMKMAHPGYFYVMPFVFFCRQTK